MPRAVPKPPRPETLANYGLTADDWRRLCRECKCICFVCGKPFGDRPLVVDHQHVKGFRATKKVRYTGKRKGHKRVRVMPPEERRKYVRGVLHNYCNRFVRRWLTLERAEAIVLYLRKYHASCRQEKPVPASRREMVIV